MVCLIQREPHYTLPNPKPDTSATRRKSQTTADFQQRLHGADFHDKIPINTGDFDLPGPIALAQH